MCIPEDGSFPDSVGLETEDVGLKKLQYFNQVCLKGLTRSGLAGLDPLYS